MWQIGVNQHLSAETQAKPVVGFWGVCIHTMGRVGSELL